MNGEIHDSSVTEASNSVSLHPGYSMDSLLKQL